MKTFTIKIYEQNNVLLDEVDVNSLNDAFRYLEWREIDYNHDYIAQSFRDWDCMNIFINLEY